MLQSAFGFVAGYACRAQCGSFPCAASCKGAANSRPFKLSIVIHSAAVEKIGGPGLVQDQRPYITIRINDKQKETELGDWSAEKEQWCFREVITLEVVPTDEVFIAVSSSTKYDFWLASVQLTSTKIGEACFPVFSVLPRLKQEDRDEDGIIWSSPIIPFDVRDEGITSARTYISFETSQAPGNPRCHKLSEGCCQMSRKWDSADDDGPYDSSPSTRESE
ncbi:unnamed protein product [Symbiodinium pilosum]|uniref:C2 domain-containing protein n=1 Tax=Symbiodinium pilosum TaxID=2952 RepID=A0A812UQD6_SYMPI|nr:unnamed protein product [Symbiodinium pilosum]